MRFKLLFFPIVAVSLLSMAVPGWSQVTAPYARKGLPIEVGAGPSAYNPDWGQGIMYGGTVWVDYFPIQMPSYLRGLGLEFEARDISLDRHLQNGQARSGQGNTKEDTLGGGVIYSVRRFRNFRPYGKFVASLGSVDFISPSPTYSHDTRTVLAGGGGLEYRIYKSIWARGDYEYQNWGQLLGKNILTPEGITAGITYDFSRPSPKSH
jgi:opacity protein-like surface antigen